MALDEPKKTDDVFSIKGLKFIVDKIFMEKARNIRIDFTGMGFRLDSNINLGDSGSGGCSGCSTTGSCGD